VSVQAIAWVLDHSESTNTARCVLVSIANHMGGDGSGWVYVDRVCKEANCSLKSYHRAVQWAIDNGELERTSYSGGYERTHVRHRPNLFSFPALSEGRPQIAGGCTGQNGEEGTGQSDYHPPSQSDHHNSKAVSKAVSKAITNTSGFHQEVFDAWCAATGRDAGRTKLTADRVKKMDQRIAEGYSVEELVEAVQGVALSAFHMGENDKQQRYDDLTTVLRSGSQVEKFRDLFRAGPLRREPKGFATILSAVEKLEQRGGPQHELT
jgi:hypothetical protein